MSNAEPRVGAAEPRVGAAEPRVGAAEARSGFPRLRLPSAARFGELLEGLRLPRFHDRRAVPALAALAAVTAAVVIGARALTSRLGGRGAFPRRGAQVAGGNVDAQLAAEMERLDADPENLQALVEAGTLRFLKGPDQYRGAINELEEARKLGSVDPRLFYYLGVMYQEEGLLPYAVAEYHKFVRNFPDDRETRLLLGKLLYQTGKYEDAAVQFQSLGAAAEPRVGAADPVVVENLGLCELALKRYDEARKSFESLLARPAFAPRAHYYLGAAEFEQGRFPQARDHIAQATQVPAGALEGVDPAALWASAAAVDEKLQDWPAAEQHWKRLLALDPKSAKAKASLYRIAPRLRALKAAAAKAAKAKRSSALSKHKSAKKR